MNNKILQIKNWFQTNIQFTIAVLLIFLLFLILKQQNEIKILKSQVDNIENNTNDLSSEISNVENNLNSKIDETESNLSSEIDDVKSTIRIWSN